MGLAECPGFENHEINKLGNRTGRASLFDVDRDA